jgi:hypothetical protein
MMLLSAPLFNFSAEASLGVSRFADFWPCYVRAHSKAATRVFHLAGTLLGWSLLLSGLLLRNGWLVLLAPVVPYPIVWFSHFFIEHNQPATFGHPAWSWLADQKMVWMMLTGRMSAEVERVLRETPSVTSS